MQLERRPVRLTGEARKVLHNHTGSQVLKYRGFAPTAPMYHLFECIVRVDGPRLEPIPEWKDVRCNARKGCPASASFRTPDRRRRFCDEHAKGYDVGPCPYKVMFPCPIRMGINLYMPPERHVGCVICEQYEQPTQS